MPLQAQGAGEASSSRRFWNSSSRKRGNPGVCCCSWVLHPESSGTTFTVLGVYQAAWTVGETAFDSLWCLKGLVIPHSEAKAWLALQSVCAFTFSWELCVGKRLMEPQSLEVHWAQGKLRPEQQFQAWELMFWRNKTEIQLCELSHSAVTKSLLFRGISERFLHPVVTELVS